MSLSRIGGILAMPARPAGKESQKARSANHREPLRADRAFGPAPRFGHGKKLVGGFIKVHRGA